MNDRLYIGSIIGDDNYYYKAVMRQDLFVKEKESPSTIGSTTLVNVMAKGVNGAIYVGEGEVIKRYNPQTLEVEATSASVGNTILSLTIGLDGSVYVGAANVAYIKKYDPNTLSLTGQSPSTGSNVYGLTVGLDGSIYAGGSGSLSLKKFNPDTLSLERESIVFGGTINSAAVGLDGSIYIGIDTEFSVKKLNPETLAVDASATNFTNTEAILVDSDGDVYVGGPTFLAKLDPITLSEITRKSIRTYDLAKDSNDVIYVASSPDDKIYAVDTGLNILGQTEAISDGVNALAIGNDTGIYFRNSIDNKLNKMFLLYRLLGYRRS